MYREKIDPGLFITDELRSQTLEMIEKVDGLWECRKCSQTFLQRGLARRHTEIHLTNTIYSCTICTKTARTRKSLREHLKDVHEDLEASLVCGGCGRSGMKKKQFKNHTYHCRKYKAQL